MHYQREELAGVAPDTGDGVTCELRLKLNEHTALFLQHAEAPPAHFFLGGIAGFLARALNQSSISIGYQERVLRIHVDTSLPFNELLSQIEIALSAGPDLAQMEAPDAYFHIASTGSANGSAGSDAPVFTAETDQGGWIVLTTSQWAEDKAQRYLGYLRNLLENAAQDPLQPIATLRLTTDAAALDLYRDLNNTKKELPAGITVLELFKQQAAKFNFVEAVSFEGASLSYAELDAASSQLAETLGAHGADQARPVAICLPRSEQLPVVLLAVLKAGSYFVPLDPSHPRQRLIDMLEECAPAVVLVSPQTQPLFAGTTLPLLDPWSAARKTTDAQALRRVPTSNDKAYMIYTSGTTGKPKGVIITHGALANFLLAMRDRPGIAEGERMLAVVTLSFDISLMDMFLPLICGATLVIASEQATKDPRAIANLLDTESITSMQATPVTWRMLVSSGYSGERGLKMFVGGEALPRDLAQTLLQWGGELWNCYGPTETTIWSSVRRVEEGEGPVTIGGPMANTLFYVADEAGQLLPPEIAGELYIGGSGVAAGYFERPELNRERFVPDAWTASSLSGSDKRKPRLFRTGDLVRLADARTHEFEIFGRIDHQIKLRGYRIELGEIESVLRTHPSIAYAAVVLREDEPGDPWLVGYVTKNGAAADTAGWKQWLEFASQRLPQYMLPSRIVTLATLPLTGSGKVDRRALAALPAPLDADESWPHAYGENGAAAQPLDATETILLRIFREVLRLKSFGPDDNFFEHGGYSLLAIRLFAKISTVLHVQLPITALFDAPTARRLAALIRGGDALQSLVPIRTTGKDAPFFLIHSYLLYGLIGNVVDAAHPVYGLRESSTSTVPLDLERCITDYISAINRVWPTGPVHLGGWCAAATLTIEIARRLMLQGRQAGMIALFDAEAPGFVPRPPSGSRRVARLRAMWHFHLGRMRGLKWMERVQYIQERLAQVPLNLIDAFYARNHARMEQWGRRFPWLPSRLFFNRFTQIGQLQTDHVEQLNARIQLFRARDVTVIPGSDPACGWGDVARLGVAVSYIPGHHESMFLEPNVEILKKEFQAAMRTVEASLAAGKHFPQA